MIDAMSEANKCIPDGRMLSTCRTIGCSRRSGLDKYGYCFQHRQTIPCFKVKLEGGSSYIASLYDLKMTMDGEIDGAEEGQKWSLELIYMTQHEYKNLPDVDGVTNELRQKTKRIRRPTSGMPAMREP